MSRKTTRFTSLSLLASTLFSFHISPDLRKAVPLAPMSGNHISYEVEVIRAQESFASEMAGNIHPLYTRLSWRTSSHHLLLLMPFMSIVLSYFSYSITNGER